MAASDESCDGNPDFAVICSFITKFGNDCGVNVTIADLQQMLEDTKNVHEDLAELHIHLLRRGRKRVTKEKWERSLIKFCHEYSSVDAWELERFGYKKAKLSVKLELLKRLLELQFDSNAKFKSEVNKHEAHSLRIPPIGRDIDGQLYWYQLDREYNMRLYRQGPEEDGTWKLLCSNTDHLRNLLANLQKNNTKDLLPEDTPKLSPDNVDSTTLKMETDGDDLTSRMSETKPNTIIIKTEKKETPSTSTTDGAKSPVKVDDEITLVEQEKTVSTKATPTDQEIKPEKDQDKKMDVTEVVIKKEVSSTPEEGVTPMEVDDCIPEKSGDEKVTDAISKSGDKKVTDAISKSDVEMLDAEQAADTKKAQLSPVEKDLSKSTKGDSKTIEKHLIHTDTSSIIKHPSTKSVPVAEHTISKDPLMEPSVEKASPSETKSLPSKDVQDPSDVHSNVGEQIEAKYKGSKIKLYEKWSNEKKLAAAADAKQSLKGATHQQQKGAKAVENSPDSTLSKSKSSIISSGTSQSEEVPMDLSVSFRSDDAPSKGTTENIASDLTSSKKAPTPEKTNRNHVSISEKHLLLPSPEKKSPGNASETPRPFKKKHLSMAAEETTSDLSRKSVIFEVKSNKLLNQLQEGGDSTKKDKVSSNSGFSHLQALQNMCNENPMTCFQSSVIRSGSPDKRLKTEGGLPNFNLNSSEKSSYNPKIYRSNCDNISQKYKFSSSQLSGDVKHFSENDVPPLLLKSNVQSSSDTTSPPQKSSNVFKSSEVQDSIINSSKNISPSVSDNLGKQLKDTECSESASVATSGKHSPQTLKVDSEKISTFKKHPRTNDHSVASIMEREYKEVSKPNLNESPGKCDNLKEITGDISKSSLQTTDRDKIVATDKALNCLDKTSETVLSKICSAQDLPESATEVSIDSETIKTTSDVSKVVPTQITSEKTTTKVESNISVDTELKSTKIIGKEEADMSCISDKTKPEKDSLVQSDTSSTKVESGSAILETQSVSDSKSLTCETDRTCDTAENKNLNCDKSEKNKQCSTVASDSVQPDVKKQVQSDFKKSEDSKDIKTEVVSSNLTKEIPAIDNSMPLTLSPNKSDEKSIGSIACKNSPETKSKDLQMSVECRTDKVDVATSNKIKHKTCEEKSVLSLEIESIKTDSACEEVGKSSSQKTDSKNEKPSLVPESSETPAEPPKTIKDSKKKVNDKHSIANIIDKKESENKLTTNGDVGPKKEAKEPYRSTQTKSLPPEIGNSNKQIELDSKNEVDKLTKDESHEEKLEALVKDTICEKKDCAPMEETNLSVKVDIDEGKLKENLSKNKDKLPDSTKTDSSPCTSNKVSVHSPEKTCKKTKSEIPCEDIPASPKKHTIGKTLEENEQVTNSKQDTQDMTSSKIDSVKESISEKSIEIAKGNSSEIDSKSNDLTTTILDGNESIATEVSKEKVEVSSKEITEPKDSETISDKKDIEKPLESNKILDDESAILAAESPVEENEEAKISTDDVKDKEKKNEESVATGKADDKGNADLITKCPVKGEEKIPEEHGAKPKDISESIPEKKEDNIKKENSTKTTKDSKRKLSKSTSKLKEQVPSPESLKKIEKKDKADHSKKDKKFKDIKNVVSTDVTNEDNCIDSSLKEKDKEPLSKEVPEKSEPISIDSSKKKSVSLKTKIKINIKDPLGVYFVLHNTCLESKMRHPSFENLKKIPPPSLKSKPKLITTFSMDTTDEVHIIQTMIDTSPTKKKRGRLRQSKNPTPVESKATPTKTKSSSKTPTSSKKAATAVSDEKEGFHIPEGFLEILSNTQSDGSSAKKETQRKPRGRKLKISAPSLENSESESTPIKRSRRIQDIQQKKMSELAVEMEREQRILEQLAKKSAKKDVPQKSPIKAKEAKLPKSPKPKFQPPSLEESASNTCMEIKRAPRKMNSRSRNMTKMHLLYEDESKDSEFSTSRETEKSKKRRRGRGGNGKKGFKPWDVSSESESTLEELTEEEEEEHEEPLVFEVNEDEFACEEVEEDAEPIVVRRARTAKKIPEGANVEEIVVADDKPCLKCGKHDKPEWILLCDKCDSGYHTTCLIPPLMLIPEGDWYCQPCEHIFLCDWIQKELHKLEVVLKQREREELRKQRLAYVGISLDNVLKPEKKEISDESSREDDKEEDESEEEDSRDVKSSRRRDRDSSSEEDRHKKLYGKRSVRARRTVNYQFKEYDELIASAIGDELVDVKLPAEEAGPKVVDDDEENDSDKAFQAKFPKQKKRKTTRLNDLDFSEDEDSGEEYKGSSASDSEQTAPPSVSGSDGGSAVSGEWRVVGSKGKKPKRKKKRGKRGDDSEEDWDDEDDSDTYRPVTRRAKQKSISYREVSSDDEWDPKPKAVKKRKKFTSSEDSEASYKKKKSKTAPKPKKKRVRKWASSDSSEESERSINFSESSGSENKWKVKKTSEDSRLKININKKVLSSDENDEESQESATKKRPNKIVSEEEEESEEEEGDEEEEEGSSEEEEEEEEEEDGKDSKQEVKDPKPEVKAPKLEAKAPKPEAKVPKPEAKVPKPEAKVPEVLASKLEVKDPSEEAKLSLPTKVAMKSDAVKVDETQGPLKKDSNICEAPVEPIKEKIVVSMVQDKPPVRTVKKDATKMVPCVIPYDKSPKSGHGTTPEDESDRESIQNTPKPVTYTKSIPQQYLPKTVPKPPIGVITSTVTPPKLVTKTVPVSDRRPFASSIVQPFSNLDEDVDSDDEVPLERIPTAVPNPLPTKPSSYERETKYTPAKELPGFTYTAPEEKCFPPTYSNLAPFQDYSSRPSPLKPSLVETYNRSSPSKLTPLDSYTQTGGMKGPYPLKPSLVETYNRSSPSKLTPLDSYSQSNSPKGFISLDSYSEARKKKQHFYGNPGTDQEIGPRPPPPDTYQREIGFPPEPTPFPPSPSTYHRSTPPHIQRDPGTPPRFHSQYPDGYAPPRSPEYYQNSQYYHGEDRVPRPSYQPNYAPPEHGGPPYVQNPYVATPVPQPNGGFMIDTLLRARNPEDGEDELTGVTDIVSYITQE